jgi:adenosine deaminase
LSPFPHIRQIFQDEEVLRLVAASVVKAAAEDNVRYLELHLTPSALASSSGHRAVEVTDWVCQAARQAAEERAITVKFIVSLNRHESLARAEESVQAAVDLSDLGIVAVDLAGDEAGHGAEGFLPLLKQAKEDGLAVSVHAGEWDGPRSVAYALENLQVDRIIHGVRIMEDPELVRVARERRLPFAVCLTSNFQSGVVHSLEAHPLPMMLAAGLQVSLGTDDPSVSQTTLTQEYQLAEKHLDLGFDSMRGMMLAGAQAAFAPEKERRLLETKFQEWLGLAPNVQN